jgi:glutathione peroxidase
MESFYRLKAKRINGEKISMDEYKGKTILVVNVASKCGFTPQYEGLEKLYKENIDKGLQIPERLFTRSTGKRH